MNFILYKAGKGTIPVEVAKKTRVTRGDSRTKEKLNDHISDVNMIVKNVSEEIDSCVKSLNYTPDEISVEIGIKFSAEAGAILAKAATEGAIKVELKWMNKGINNERKET